MRSYRSQHGFLARASAFGAKPRLRRKDEAGRELPSHESQHKRKRTLALFGLVRIELCEDEEIAVRRENAPGGNDLVTVARDRQAAYRTVANVVAAPLR